MIWHSKIAFYLKVGTISRINSSLLKNYNGANDIAEKMLIGIINDYVEPSFIYNTN